jgi:serine/threonine protein phosphatase PrpC
MNNDKSLPQDDDGFFDLEKVEALESGENEASPAITGQAEPVLVQFHPVETVMDSTEQSQKEHGSEGDSLIHVNGSPDQHPAIAPKGSQEGNFRKKDAVPRIINLPNAHSGEPYDKQVDLEDFEQLVSYKIDYVDGLAFFPDTRVVRGTPTRAGDYKVTLKVISGGHPQDIEVRLTVIPDPKTLWKNLPSDKEGKFWKPDEECKSVRGELFLVGASKRGRSHAQVGSFRDDDFGILYVPSSGWHIGIAADGGGSSKYSRRASQKVVEYISQNLPSMLEEQFSGNFDDWVGGIKLGTRSKHEVKTSLYRTLLEVSFKAAQQLETLVEDLESAAEKSPGGQPLTYTIKDFSTTLILCVAKKSKHGWFIGTFSIGDGGAVVLDLEQKTAKLMTTGDSGEFAGETRFLAISEFSAAKDPSKRLHYDISDSFDSIVLMTDGITDPFFPTDVELQDFEHWFDFWINNLGTNVDLLTTSEKTELELLSWLDFWSLGNHDDRTIVLLRNLGIQ